ncbi:hypothetical protein ACLB2K_039672 [Fragaria x ananassa]
MRWVDFKKSLHPVLTRAQTFLSLFGCLLCPATLRPILATPDGETTIKLLLLFSTVYPNRKIQLASTVEGDRLQWCTVVFFVFRRTPVVTVTVREYRELMAKFRQKAGIRQNIPASNRSPAMGRFGRSDGDSD